jgi:hypothetical protein
LIATGSRGTLAPIPVLFQLWRRWPRPADNVSSELGQVLSSQPRMITTLRRADAGTDGAISVGGIMGVLAADDCCSSCKPPSPPSSAPAPMLAQRSGGGFGLLFDAF